MGGNGGACTNRAPSSRLHGTNRGRDERKWRRRPDPSTFQNPLSLGVLGWAADLPQADFHATNNRQPGGGATRNPPPLVEITELRRAMRKNGSASLGNAIRARGRHHLWTCAPSNQKIHDMSILCQYFCNMYGHHPAHQAGFWVGAGPCVPPSWPRHDLIQPASPIGKSTRGGKNVSACVKICHPLQQVDRKTTRPRKQCHLTCAGPLHGKVHNVKTKNNVSPEIGGKASATQRNML